MRLWTPRRPSASQRAKIFSHNTATSPDADLLSPIAATFFRSVLAPTLACVMITLAVFNHSSDSRPSNVIWAGSNMLAVVESTAQNRWDRVSNATFDWTNRGAFRSSIPFTSATNFSQ